MTSRPVYPRPHALLEAASAAVLHVGGLLREWRADPAATSGQWEGSQFKARADALAHEALAARLAAIDEAIPVLSEEDPASHGTPSARPVRYWLIDPIDGTASFAAGFAGYVTQAALVVGTRPALSAIYAPEHDVLYTAVRGSGAAANGRLLAAHGPAPPGKGVLTDNTPRPHGIARAVYDHFGYSGYLECGSIALKLCRIAEGTAQLFVKDVPVRDWDVAAPELLLTEIGGKLSRLDGTDFPYRAGFEHSGLVGAASPETCAAVARWCRTLPPNGE
ncbi:3'-phosphoadenosine 5'-phosphosulfate (PAPS) 3'-phosphatase [Lipingzhangella halophila]|uniref:inositol-phosphate phosphatase n=1 Tax=Lipingzhangella halophila TaxID=1783352 RepID=A0A7W7W4T5_9ACTN|nr:inositol monophosphatase family protein [Lipingzhangella halophila]MBB4933060.1 3'-phosphoadenosine 5'-phosphosulfate (PAPS) 3'-phosphatase [Lipingzhangella halophila]